VTLLFSSASLFSSATDVSLHDSVESSLKGGMNLASMHTHYASTSVQDRSSMGSPAAASSFDGSCLCNGTKWDGKAVFYEEGGVSASCGAMGGYITSLLGNSMNGGEAHETSTSPCNDVKQVLDMYKDHPDPTVTEAIASVEDTCCAGPVPAPPPPPLHPPTAPALLSFAIGGCALVGIGLAVRKKKAQRSDYAEMPK
jgi:hypothetical protein